MSKKNLDTMTRNFLLGESKSPSIMSYIQAVNELLQRLSPRSLKEIRNLEIVKEHMKEIKSSARKLNEQIQMLEERVSTLEESKGK